MQNLEMVEQELLERVKKIKTQENKQGREWVTELGKWLGSIGVDLPSVELGQVLVSELCFHNNEPSLWKFIHAAMSFRLLSPLHVLSLLSSRVIPHRRSQPEAFRMFLELLSSFAFSLDFDASFASKHKIVLSVDDALQLSQTYKVCVLEFGHVFVFFFFSIVVGLIDCTLYDLGFQLKSLDITSGPFGISHQEDMDVDVKGDYNFGTNERRELLRKTNSSMAIEVLTKLTESRKAMILLRLIQLNMPEQFNGLLQRLWLFKASKLASSNISSTYQLLERLSSNIQRVDHFEFRFNKSHLIWILNHVGPFTSSSYCNSEIGQSACWVAYDIFMENAMDGRQLSVRSASAVLTEIIKTLKVFNHASWHETFLAVWISALRLVQRQRDPVEGPTPQPESRLCILLTIVPLAIANILKDDAVLSSTSAQEAASFGYMENENKCRMEGADQTSRKYGLISSLQVLGHFSGLLCPPASFIGAANSAAAKATIFVSNSKNPMDGLVGRTIDDTSVTAGGNMWHLIIEACIARNLVDTSAYFWPGYVSSQVNSLLCLPAVQKSPWITFMEGAPLGDSLINLLVMTPATSLAEVEKLYHIALNGLEQERSAAAKILCGASLISGWNIQEHVVRYVVKLLSPPIPPTHTGQRSHLVDYMPMLNAILYGASSIDTVHVLSLHGLIPEVAASLMPLCEVFGSLMPTSNSKSNSSNEYSVYTIFSSAFLFLLRLWKFYRPPPEQCLTGGGTPGGELSLEYLLMLRNSRISSDNCSTDDETDNSLTQIEKVSDKPVYIEFYPKLQAWYCQNKFCIASPLSGLCTGNPVHQVANRILNMIYHKMTTTESSPGTSTPSSNSLSESVSAEEPYQRPTLPAWEVLEAIPFVLEAILTACAHGRLSSRDLTTGLRDLIGFLPAAVGVIISYISAEITRGIWKPVPMNGTDWPSPAPILPSMESEMKEIFALAGVKFPGLSFGTSPLMLPLPMAALVSLTITFKLNKELEYIHAVVGPALENCASGCPWPTIPIIGSLWAQKVRRWHHFIVFSCVRSLFRQDKEAVAQLLRSCFSSFLGYPNVSAALLTNQSCVNSLLGNIIAVPGECPSLAPGFLYLRSCRTIQDVQYVNDVIVDLVAEFARESATRRSSTQSSCLKSSQASLSFAAAKAREAAILGASLLCISGGMNLVQQLYRDTIPTWLLMFRAERLGKANVVPYMAEGYAMAYMLVLSGSFVWGVGERSPPWALSRRASIFGGHMDFLARVLEGNISLGCHPTTWKGYVCCLVGLVVSFAPAWIQEVKIETLRKLAGGLRRWHESELALSLLERGGVAAFESVAELVNAIN